ncbi:MAG: AAA family ATPase [Bacillota bacterium]|nr:AAA family ATPase [Bacillota bacterium]
MNNIKFLPGQLIEITTNSDNNSDRFQSKFLAMNQNYLEISIPTKDGNFSAINTGYNLCLSTQTPYGTFQFNSKVVGKNSDNHSIFISPPQNIITSPNADLELNSQTRKSCKFVTIASGKGGTGKSCFAVNYAMALAKRNKRVVIIDADFGMANIDVLLKLSPIYNIVDVIKGYKTLEEIIIDGPGDIKVIPGGNGLLELSSLSSHQVERITSGFSYLEENFDYVLIDTSAGFTRTLNELVLSSHETILVTTPEPHAISDAFSILKVLISMHHSLNLKLVVNRCETPEEGESVIKRISGVVSHFPNCNFEPLGFIPDSRFVNKAVKEQAAFLLSYPESDAAESIESIVGVELGEPRKVKIVDKQELTATDNNLISSLFGNDKKSGFQPFNSKDGLNSTFVSKFKGLFNKN